LVYRCASAVTGINVSRPPPLLLDYPQFASPQFPCKLPSTMSKITINGNTLDPAATGRGHVSLLAANAKDSDYILIQTAAPPTDEQKQRSVEAVDEDIPLFLDSESTELRLVDIEFHGDIGPNSERVTKAIAAAAHVDAGSLEVDDKKIRLEVEERYLDDIARVDAVRDVYQVHPTRLFNNIARGILKSDYIDLNGNEYQGEGQIVAVADTGFDKGSKVNMHPAFSPDRVKHIYALGRTGKASDEDGHGTHVCGSVLGNGYSDKYGVKIQGAAPKATLVMQSIMSNPRTGALGGIPTNLAKLFGPPYNEHGARIHTNSWGSSSDRPGQQLDYDSGARAIDDFIWSNPDMVICFAAGNDGVDFSVPDGVIDPRQIGAEASAKNCITVGASENYRPDIKGVYDDLNGPGKKMFPKHPISDDLMANDPDGLAAFSSRGLTKENRLKPDVVTPGTSILSTKSSVAPMESFFGVSKDPEWMFLSGTSMATPLVAGCVAVLRESLVKNGKEKPSAALIKALLINGADGLKGQYTPSEAGMAPNPNSGFGRVNVANSIVIPGQTKNAGFGEGGPIRQGEEQSFTIQIPIDEESKPKTLKITLVWSDPAHAKLQNDLDLIVFADGKERHGNMGEDTGFDRLNNVEQVVWSGLHAGEVKVVVRAYRITKFPQPYAYAWKVY
jgi:serine protease AprX